MTRLIALGVRLGNLIDELARVARSMPRQIRRTLALRRYRWITTGIAAVYLLIYLVTLGDIDFSTSGRFERFASIPSVQVVPGWSDMLFAERAPFLYESIATIYVLPQLAFFVSVGNIVVASVLGLLLALNVTVGLHASAQVESCRRRVYMPALGILPTFLMGFACCAPTFLVALGANFAAAFLPVFIPVRSYLLPLAVALMAAMLVWSARRTRVAEAALSSIRSEETAPGPDGDAKRARRAARSSSAAS